MPAPDSVPLPLVSRPVLENLQNELQDPGLCRSYLLSYLGMWDARSRRLQAAVHAGDTDAAMDAVLSIRTSARMIGALRLAGVAAEIEQCLESGGAAAAAALLEALDACGQTTMEELRQRVLPRLDRDWPPAGGDPLREFPGVFSPA